jgi:hypothetical protein
MIVSILVTVLLNGHPFVGARVAYERPERPPRLVARTDRHGHARVRLRRGLRLVVMRPPTVSCTSATARRSVVLVCKHRHPAREGEEQRIERPGL